MLGREPTILKARNLADIPSQLRPRPEGSSASGVWFALTTQSTTRRSTAELPTVIDRRDGFASSCVRSSDGSMYR